MTTTGGKVSAFPPAIFLKDCILYITAHVFWRLLIQSGFLQFSDPEVIE